MVVSSPTARVELLRPKSLSRTTRIWPLALSLVGRLLLFVMVLLLNSLLRMRKCLSTLIRRFTTRSMIFRGQGQLLEELVENATAYYRSQLSLSVKDKAGLSQRDRLLQYYKTTGEMPLLLQEEPEIDCKVEPWYHAFLSLNSYRHCRHWRNGWSDISTLDTKRNS